MRRLESSIERACKRIAEGLGYMLLKIERRKGWPDRILILPGSVVWIEFKREGELASPLQLWVHKKLQSLNQTVIIVRSVKDFEELL